KRNILKQWRKVSFIESVSAKFYPSPLFGPCHNGEPAGRILYASLQTVFIIPVFHLNATQLMVFSLPRIQARAARHAQRGFSLIEIMVVVVIMGVLAALVV